MEADLDKDGKISFEEFTKMVENTDISISMTLGMFLAFEQDSWIGEAAARDLFLDSAAVKGSRRS